MSFQKQYNKVILVVEDDKAITVLNALVLIFWTDTKLSILSIIIYLYNSIF
jgi:hypothetical protein